MCRFAFPLFVCLINSIIVGGCLEPSDEGVVALGLQLSTREMPEQRLRFPVLQRHAIGSHLMIHMDRDGQLDEPDADYGHACIDYRGEPFPNCYDGHSGTDFVSRGGFVAMDFGVSPTVVAAASGEVVRVVDGYYDRCGPGDDDGHACNNEETNLVIIEHDDGFRTAYLHLMKNSIVVRPGQRVECGTPLGRIGSAGKTSFPHLHFTVLSPERVPVDPFSVDREQSYWVDQSGESGLPASRCN